MIKVSSEDLQHARAVVALEDLSLCIAQEGVLARLFNGLKQALSSYESTLQALGPAYEKLEKRGTKHAVISSPGWGRRFVMKKDSKQLNGKDAIYAIKEVSGYYTSDLFKDYARGVKDSYKRAAKLLEQGNKQLTEEGVKEMWMLSLNAKEFAKEGDYIIKNEFKSPGGNPDFLPLSPGEAQRLVAAINNVATSASISNLINGIVTAVNTFGEALASTQNRKLQGQYIDVELAIKMNNALMSNCNRVLNLVMSIESFAFSSLQYIRESTN